MKRCIEVCGIALCVAAAGCTEIPPSKETAGAAAARKPAAAATVPASPQEEAAPDERDSAASPQPDVAAHGGGKRESLTCFAGTEDRHARIGIELVNDRVNYFAFYSKWKPRTCSIDAGRGDARTRWTSGGGHETVTLPGHRGTLRIERKGGAYRFAFIDVDRVRYCGMQGKINGSLTVTRGKSTCVVQGIMDGHAS